MSMNLVSGTKRLICRPACRVYARLFVGDEPADRLFQFLSGLEFWSVHRFWPNFVQPQTFSEKIWSRMIFDRNPLWTMFSDKLRVRDYVAGKIGDEYLIPLLWSGDDPEDIPFDELPSKFVMKANHGCDYNIIVTDRDRIDRKRERRKLARWLGENFCQDYMVGAGWGYKNIRPTIIVESFLEDRGQVPVDYKFYCFSGRVEYMKIDFARLVDHAETFFDRDLNVLDLFERGLRRLDEEIERPENYELMVQLAERLAENLDFIRVDLYNLQGHIYFGELTCYPGGGVVRLCPSSYERVIGEKWRTASNSEQFAWTQEVS